MPKRAVVLGRHQDGSYALRCSLPGYDALTDDMNDINKCSFNSDWTDLVRVKQLGIVNLPSNGTFGIVPYPPMGFCPFVEVRQVDATTAYDDNPIDEPINIFFQGQNYPGSRTHHAMWTQIRNDHLEIRPWNPPYSAFYMILEPYSGISV